MTPAPNARWGQRLVVAVLAAAMVLPPAAHLPAEAQTINPRSRAPVTVNFVNADIEAVTRAFAVMIDRNIVVDPRVRGTITVYSERPQSIREAYTAYVSALRGLGYAVVETGGLLKVVPEADAKLQAGTVSIGEPPERGGEVLTQVFQLRFENPNNLVAVLRPLISANNTINAAPGANALVITDYAENLRRIAQIVAALDRPSGTDVEVVPLTHAVAADLAPLVQRLVGGPTVGVPGVPANIAVAGGVTVVADARANALIVKAANPARLAEIRAVIARLDIPNPAGPDGGMYVVHLKNADAVRLATVIRAAFAGGGGGGSAGGGASGSASVASAQAGAQSGGGASPQATAPVAGAAPVSTGGFVQADPATNSLIITAPEPLYRQVRALIDQLDTRRAQVYIESMIVEVAPSDSADFGFQWQGLLGKSGDRYGLIAGTNYGAAGRPSIIDINTSAAQGQVNLGQGLNLGLLSVINGVTSLAAIARMLQSQSETNIVSTPNLITLDNEEAKIVVGENVPFITGQFTNTGSGAVSNPFQTIERKDVGITLRIRPQIGEGGAVRMQIFQEQSSVKETTAAGTSNAGPSTTKRSIENSVVVDDGAILVLGGLIEDRFVTTRSKVPLLGDLPLVGGLFRSESRERRRTNLMVFLRPVVVRDADSANRLSLDRYDQIRAQQQAAQPAPSVVMPINESPVLPPIERPDERPASAPAAPAAASPKLQLPRSEVAP